MYVPDFWTIIKITGEDPHYRVFASWAGGYTYGGSWRMNSGITKCEETEDSFIFHGSTGSKYECRKESYGIHYHSIYTLEDYIERSGGKISKMPEETNWLEMDWIIS